MPIIIDGHNLLWSIQKTGADSGFVSDVRLCHIVARYLKLIGEKGEIIFDGAGPPDKSDFDYVDGVEVFFAGPGADADSAIEDKIRASTAPKGLTIVSSDRRLQAAARARKAAAIKSERFWAGIKKQFSQSDTAKEPPGKRHGLTEGETEQWLKFFGIKY